MESDIVARLRKCGCCDSFEAADEIERLRKERDEANEIAAKYRRLYLRCLASTVWKAGTRWKTYVNPQRSDGLFVATVGELLSPHQAVPRGGISLMCQLPHDEAEAVVAILNEWSEREGDR